MDFDYQEAFSRNLGWVTEAEQAIIRGKRVAIAGLGGVGGSHLLTLSRLGLGAFTLADFDQFELPNFNRQAGATVSHLGRKKLEVMSAMARDINPFLDIRAFPQGVNRENLDSFLDGVDLYVDALDFFALDIRREVFAACYQRGIPAITAAPLAMGSALLCFMPGKMSFEEYFRLEGHSEREQALRFMLGLAPRPLHMAYLVDDTRINFESRKTPSTPMGCELCAGFAGAYALKVLLRRGDLVVAPRGIHFDAYRNKLVTTWRPGGNRHPLQQLGLNIARRRVMADDHSSPGSEEVFETAAERILGLARWAPSGDNEQPWKFEILADDHIRIHGSDTRHWCVYDLDGSSSQIALGALLETLRIAASAEGMRAEIARCDDAPEERPLFDVRLVTDAAVAANPLLPFITARVTQRRPFTTEPLDRRQKSALEQAVGPSYRVIWLEGREQRWRVAKLLFHNAHVRLTTPEAYEVHRQNIEWGVRFSEDRIPEQALGVDALTAKVMRWVLGSWERVKFANRFLAGTWLPRLQMDLQCGLRCAAHFVIVADRPHQCIDDHIEGGAAMMRFWLESVRQGLQFQPEMTPLIFSRYVAQGRQFTGVASEQALAEKLAAELDAMLGPDQDPFRRVYMGRVGVGPAPESRSTRPPLAKLLVGGSG